ncbi:MAG: redox-sensing transcriptional repressor Rex [Chitinispirillaceae bacterium]|nr:redox-sensing transcriptional repressor Rex [Chitinispirillaceae bacterium]
MNKIPFPVIHRLSYVFEILNKLEEQGIKKVSSAQLGKYLGQTAHTVRKDIHFIGIAGTAGTKYDIAGLKTLISRHLGFGIPKKSCIVGLGKLGSALLEYTLAIPQGAFRIVAGFDSNINRVETIHTPIELFPAYRIEETVKRLQIELALIVVPPQQAQEAADRCCDGGVTGLLNFTPTVIKPKRDGIFVRSIDISGELRILAALAYTTTIMNE